jgi:radical SAM protein with 4Fe4S-binding SPASM domain
MKRIIEKGRISLIPQLPLSTPFVINVDPSSVCNFQCKFCFHSNNEKIIKKGIMPWHIYKDIIYDIKQFDKKLKTLRLYAFGEPLLNPHFSDMIRYAKNNDVSETIDTTTNGSKLNPKLNLDIIDAGIDRINISVEGVNAHQYKDFSNYDIDFKKYVENIKHLYENKKQCTIFIKINGDIISEEDKNTFLEIFSPISDGIAIENVMSCWYDFKMELMPNKNVGVYGQPLKEVQVCPYIFYNLSINYNGMVSACFLDWNQKIIIGNILTESIKNIWNGQRLQTMRLLMLQKLRHTIPICASCNQLIAGQPENLDDDAEELLKRYENETMSNL